MLPSKFVTLCKIPGFDSRKISEEHAGLLDSLTSVQVNIETAALVPDRVLTWSRRSLLPHLEADLPSLEINPGLKVVPASGGHPLSSLSLAPPTVPCLKLEAYINYGTFLRNMLQ